MMPENFFTLFWILFFLVIFIVTELCILSYIYFEEKLFYMTKWMKKVIKKARPAGKIIFMPFAFFLFILELIPNLIAITFVGIISLFKYLSDSKESFADCFMRHFS